MSDVTRRQLLQGAAAAACVGATGACAENAPRGDRMPAQGAVILFQGDSITDAGRLRDRESEPNQHDALGQGYARLLAHELLRDYPTHDLRIFNRGISGNKVPDLDARWEADCIGLRPDVLSILIGVNDIWHKLDGRYDGSVEDYVTGFAALLDRTREALPATRLVVCEPFVLRCGAVDARWFPEFDERRAGAREVAASAGATWVPFQARFDAALDAGSRPEYWAGDGVHPTMAGHSLMAEAWRDSTGL